MNNIYQRLCGFALAVLAAAAVCAPAQASLVSINPQTQDVAVGGNALVDINVSGLTEPVGGFSLTLTFNNTIVSGVSFLNDPGSLMGASPLDLSGGFSGNTLDLFFVADPTEDQASLGASEGTGFTLARLTFMGLVNGLSPLTLTNVVLSNWDGSATLPSPTIRNGQICVGGNCNVVPEPATMLLVAAALGVLATGRRKRVA